MVVGLGGGGSRSQEGLVQRDQILGVSKCAEIYMARPVGWGGGSVGSVDPPPARQN